MNKTKRPAWSKILSPLILISSSVGLILLTAKTAPSLVPAIIKIQEENLLATEPETDTYRPLKPLSLPSPQLENLLQGCPNGTLEPSAGTISHKELTNCIITLPPDRTIESSLIKDSIIQATEDTVTLQETRLILNNTILDNTPIIASPHSIVLINDSEIKNLNQSIRVKRATAVIEATSFKDNLTVKLFHVEGDSNFVVRNSLFEKNQGIILTAINKKLMVYGGQIWTLMPTLTFTNNIFLNNKQTVLSLNDVGLLGTKITNNSFTGGNSPYIEITDSHNYNILIEQNHFKDQGIFIKNSNHIILWANKFDSIQDYAVQANNSNLIAFQYNIFSDIGDTAILTKNTPQIELVRNTFEKVEKELIRN